MTEENLVRNIGVRLSRFANGQGSAPGGCDCARKGNRLCESTEKEAKEIIWAVNRSIETSAA